MNEFIRPIIRVALESDIDLSLVDSEEELREIFCSQIEAGKDVTR